MFFSNGKQTCNQLSSIDNVLKIPDVSSSAFRYLIMYVNGLNPSIPDEDAANILYMAKKYQIEPIINQALYQLKKNFQDAMSVDQIIEQLIGLHSIGLNVCCFQRQLLEN